jgi:hypothetical protein
MKKIILFVSLIGLIMFTACETNNVVPQPDNDTIAEVFELKNVNFAINNQGQFEIFRNLTPNILGSDSILIYRLSGTVNPTTPIWQIIPRTLYLPQGELDYDYDFSKVDFTIYAGGNFNLTQAPSYLNNQTFRIVIIPGAFTNRLSSPVDFSDYHAVIARYGINDRNIKQI